MKAEDIPEPGHYWVACRASGGGARWATCEVEQAEDALVVYVTACSWPMPPEDLVRFGPRLTPPASTGRVTAEDWAALDAVQARLDESERLRERLEKKYGIPPDNSTGETHE